MEHWITDISLLTKERRLDNPFRVQVAKEETSLEVAHGGKLNLDRIRRDSYVPK